MTVATFATALQALLTTAAEEARQNAVSYHYGDSDHAMVAQCDERARIFDQIAQLVEKAANQAGSEP